MKIVTKLGVAGALGVGQALNGIAWACSVLAMAVVLRAMRRLAIQPDAEPADRMS